MCWHNSLKHLSSFDLLVQTHVFYAFMCIIFFHSRDRNINSVIDTEIERERVKE